MSMVLLDTPLFVSWMSQDPRLGPERAALLDQAKGRIGLSEASMVEIADELRTGRLRFPLPTQIWLEMALRQSGAVVLPLSSAIVARSSRFADPGLDTVDRLLAATAIELDLELATWNPALSALEGIRHFF
ncbi:MAG: type II toxin-antitoxin system VapC family toxin [Fibrobacterota bacterium]